MGSYSKNRIISNLLKSGPLIVLFLAVLNAVDLNYIKYFAFNFPFILIFYWSLKKDDSLGYGYIFIAGLLNDTLTGLPIGISSLNYLLICGFAAYLRNITLRPNLIKDWFFFLFTILAINSFSYSVLSLFFSVTLDYLELFYNNIFTFLFYILFAQIFTIYQKAIFKEKND
jgi:rod shape-determining protein MreD